MKKIYYGNCRRSRDFRQLDLRHRPPAVKTVLDCGSDYEGGCFQVGEGVDGDTVLRRCGRTLHGETWDGAGDAVQAERHLGQIDGRHYREDSAVAAVCEVIGELIIIEFAVGSAD